MAIWKNIKDRAALDRAQDEAYHAAALKEISFGHRRDGLWAKAIIESGGDKVKAKIAYLRLLVVALRDEDYLSSRAADSGLHPSSTASSASEIGIPKILDRALVLRCANAISNGHAIIETYEVLLNELGGKVESKGFLLGRHYVVEYSEQKVRINNIDNLQRWFVMNVIPRLRI